MIKRMAMENIYTWMVPHTKDSGKMISSTERVLKLGLMEQSTMAIIKKVKNMEKGILNGEMAPNIMVTSKITT